LPIYTYACQSCGTTLEKRQSFSDSPLTVCEVCGGSLRRVLHPAGIIFKGSGFYNTDYKRSSSLNGTAGSSSSDGKKEDAGSRPTASDAADGASSSAKDSARSASSPD